MKSHKNPDRVKKLAAIRAKHQRPSTSQKRLTAARKLLTGPRTARDAAADKHWAKLGVQAVYEGSIDAIGRIYHGGKWHRGRNGDLRWIGSDFFAYINGSWRKSEYKITFKGVPDPNPTVAITRRGSSTGALLKELIRVVTKKRQEVATAGWAEKASTKKRDAACRLEALDWVIELLTARTKPNVRIGEAT